MTIVRAITFQGKRTASKALQAIEETQEYIWLDDVAVLSRSKNGFIRVDSTWAQSDTAVGVSAGWGAFAGALIGSMLGPQGALAGAIGSGAISGGGLGFLFSSAVSLAVADPRLEKFAKSLKNDTSALVLVTDAVYADEFSTVFTPYGGTLIETELNEHDVKAIREALKAEKVRA